jgi:hypothetical protein
MGAVGLLAEAHAQCAGAPPSAAPHTDGKAWTYLVNLTANIDNDGKIQGSIAVFDQLASLTASTKNSDQQIIVQVNERDKNQTDQFKIADGQMTPLAKFCSTTYAGDAAKLVAAAPTDGHLVLINLGHGSASGISGDMPGYTAPVEDFGDAVQAALKAGGRDKLDALSLDSCDMANPHVLSETARLSDTVVASEVVEWQSGQDIYGTLAAALKHTPADGKAFGLSMVQHSADACRAEDKANVCGTETIGLYDTTHASDLSASVSHFGEALAHSIDDPQNKATIRELIAKLPDSDFKKSQDFTQYSELHDLRSFASGVLDAIKSGRITDLDGGVARGAAQVLQAEYATIRSSYARETAWHGVSVVLPSDKNDPIAYYDGAVAKVSKAVETLKSTDDLLVSGKEMPSSQLRSILLKTAGGIKESLDEPYAPSGVYSQTWKYTGQLSQTAHQPLIGSADVERLKFSGEQLAEDMRAHKFAWLKSEAPAANARMRMIIAHQFSGAGGWNDFVTKLTYTSGSGSK